MNTTENALRAQYDWRPYRTYTAYDPIARSVVDPACRPKQRPAFAFRGVRVVDYDWDTRGGYHGSLHFGGIDGEMHTVLPEEAEWIYPAQLKAWRDREPTS